MLNFLKKLSTEVDIKLTDERNKVANSLIGKQYLLNQHVIEFESNSNDFIDGILSIRSMENGIVKTFFNVYIFKDIIFIAVYTLDLMKIIDVPSGKFVDELNKLILQ
ncbi:hypothetical protein [Mucilaginibacter sp. SP1R1]|uniref:hypothetical protein n=1 Tax=Mucilaginibacter sp. SP1R1 TaxID=2723091 RepID=UPI0016145E05|nr:hypothetical protein [Mucilaginibacter sp. SP1R1]MBB6152721.1 hypothetical protein [Mucilaginibacter sp. SP1R1]